MTVPDLHPWPSHRRLAELLGDWLAELPGDADLLWGSKDLEPEPAIDHVVVQCPALEAAFRLHWSWTVTWIPDPSVPPDAPYPLSISDPRRKQWTIAEVSTLLERRIYQLSGRTDLRLRYFPAAPRPWYDQIMARLASRGPEPLVRLRDNVSAPQSVSDDLDTLPADDRARLLDDLQRHADRVFDATPRQRTP
jgi:hypothetical protein